MGPADRVLTEVKVLEVLQFPDDSLRLCQLPDIVFGQLEALQVSEHQVGLHVVDLVPLDVQRRKIFHAGMQRGGVEDERLVGAQPL